ncbi:MAG: hypothetical protein RSD13_01290 [Clostridium sp.]|uniref:hypothetical protein n=1 Tax=Clostridium sp. TaxID=1506 RepID=UPI002FCAC3C4
MNTKKFITLIVSLVFALSLVSCSSDYDSKSVREYSDSITTNILSSMSSLNYEDFIKDFNDDMMQMAPDKSAFINLVMPIQNAVGTYEENSLEFIEAKLQKDTINVLYSAKFTNEDKRVKISISFKEDDPNHKVSGLFFNSPKIEELSKDAK